MLAHDRRRVLHFNVTAHPTAEWTAPQILEAFPFDTAPQYLLRDRDGTYGFESRKQVEVMEIGEVLGTFSWMLESSPNILFQRCLTKESLQAGPKSFRRLPSKEQRKHTQRRQHHVERR